MYGGGKKKIPAQGTNVSINLDSPVLEICLSSTIWVPYTYIYINFREISVGKRSKYLPKDYP